MKDKCLTCETVKGASARISELEASNESHRKLNGELRAENKKLKNIIANKDKIILASLERIKELK